MSDPTPALATVTAGAERFCRRLFDVAASKLTGTLTVSSADGLTKAFFCLSGAVADVDSGREETFLAQAILSTGRIPARKLRRAQKTAERNNVWLGSALLELELLSEEETVAAIRERLLEEVLEVLRWEVAEVEFTEHAEDERLEGFQSELADHFELLVDPVELILDAAAELQDWDLVRENYDLMLDVFYATPSTFHYFREPETYSEELKILSAVDGVRDVGEVIDTSGLEPFRAVRIVRELIQNGEIELINPVQMFQLGVAQAEEGRFEKAAKLFRRAIDRGLDDFDVDLHLARALAKLGRSEEAISYYRRYSSKCAAQLRFEEAVEGLRRIVELSPEDIAVQMELLEALLAQKRTAEALDVAFRIAERLDAEGKPQAALDLLLKLRQQGIRETEYHERVVRYAEKVGDERLLREEKEALARAYHERRDAAQALEAYQSMFCEGNHSLEVRLKLVELHRDQGNRRKALEHARALLALGGRQRIRDPEILRFLHETVRELCPRDPRSNRWLVRFYNENGDRQEALRVLRSWVAELERAGDYEEMAFVLDELIALEDTFEHRWARATVLEKIGRAEESRRELRSLANLATRRQQYDQAARALEYILRREPLDLQTRKVQIELLDLSGKSEEATARLRELAILEIFAGNIQNAEECCRRYQVRCPKDGEPVEMLGTLCLAYGDRQKAAEQFLKATRLHLENRNLGSARRALERLREIAPGHGDVGALESEIAARESALEAPLSGPAAASAPATPRKTPFEETAPLKTSVAGITARLRTLKAGHKGTPGKVTTTVQGAANRLKAFKSRPAAGGEASGRPPAQPDAEADRGRPSPPDGGAHGAAPSGGAGDASQGAGPAGPGPSGPPPGKTASKGAVQSAAARLRALAQAKKAGGTPGTARASGAVEDRSGGSPGGPAVAGAGEDSAPGTEVVPESETAAESPQPPAPPGGTTAQIKKPLGASASRLAALRKAAEKKKAFPPPIAGDEET